MSAFYSSIKVLKVLMNNYLNHKFSKFPLYSLTINGILDSLESARYFSIFDLPTGFHHIKMDPKDSYKTAFSTPHGHYEFDRMLFGLKTAPATFQRLIYITLTGLIGTELFVYLDDIIIFADTLKENDIKFYNLIQRLRKTNLHLQRPEFSQPFVVTTDASGYAIGGILSQGKIGKDKPTAHASRSLSDTEKK